MRTDTRLLQAAILIALCLGGCDCDRGSHTPEPSRNTVNPDTHEPYQPKQPKTTGNPMSDTDSNPDVDGPEGDST